MIKKRTNAVHINFVLILSIVLVIAVFAFSNYAKFSKTEKMINELSGEITLSEESSLMEFAEEYNIDLNDLKNGVMDFGFNTVRIFLVWIPLIYAGFLLLYSWISWLIFRPSSQGVTAYRTLMTFTFLHMILLIVVLVIGIALIPSTLKKIKMIVFLTQCAFILGWNIYTTYSKRITRNFGEKISLYDKQNQIPVVRASICTGEKVIGFKDLQTGKFQEVMLIKNDKDMQKFLKQYELLEKNIKKEW